ncbi:MAG TPA: hypothetical protein VGM75_10090 [Pseudonocardiaceae bacterium]
MVLILLVAGTVVAVAALAIAAVAAVRGRWLLPASVLGSLSLLLLVTGWLLVDPTESRADAIKTGGLAGAAVLALYATWINDRRRQVEESRHSVEQRRVLLDQDRVSDERFTKAIELLGNGAEQVRVGALHALAGLARSRPSYTQTVVDVLCSYLRNPFTHPSYLLRPDDPDQADVQPTGEWPAVRIAEADRERQVRLTAQRLIADLLPTEPGKPDTQDLDLDLTDASLDYLDLTGRHIGRFIARRARLYGASRLSGMSVSKPALFSGAAFFGRTDLFGAVFDGGLSLMDARVLGLWRVPNASVAGFVDLRAGAPAEQLGSLTVTEGTDVKLGTDTGWAIQSAKSAQSDQSAGSA